MFLLSIPTKGRLLHGIALVAGWCLLFSSQNVAAQGVNFVRLQESNDVISPDNGDRYFTQGLKLEVMGTSIGDFYKTIGIRRFFVKLNDDTTHKDHYSVAFTQDFYTPANTKADTIIPNDRPFAGTMFATFRNTSVSFAKRQRIISEISLGVLGPLAFGKEMQNGVHAILFGPDSDDIVHGWDYQLHNDIYFNYLLNLENAIFSSKYLEANSIYQFNVGTVYDDFGIGGRMRIGLFKNFFDPNLGYNTRLEKDIPWGKYLKSTSQFYLFFNPVAKMVLYNALLQGGIYNNIMSTPEHRLSENDISRIVVNGNYGVGIVAGRMKFEFIQYFTSREFDTGYSHNYGDIAITYSW